MGLLKLYGGKIILPEQVYSELSHPRIPHLKTITDNLKNNGDISIENIEMGTEENNDLRKENSIYRYDSEVLIKYCSSQMDILSKHLKAFEELAK